MYKVLIVDDEVLVRVGLKTTIDWEANGFTVVAEASNGEQGYEQYKKHMPDVIITDIKMPKRDGLWLVEEVRKENHYVKILVLTVYDEFSYARKALKVGADDYILKSEVEDEELIAVMKSIKKKIDADTRTKHIQDKEIMNVNAIKRSILTDMIKSNFNIDDNLLERCRSIGFPMENSRFAFAGISIGNDIHENEAEPNPLKQTDNAILNILFDLFAERSVEYIHTHQKEGYKFLLSSDILAGNELNRMLTSAINAARQYFDCSLNIVYTNAFDDIKKTFAVYKEFIDKEQILFYKSGIKFFITNIDSVNFAEPNVFDLKRQYNKQFIEAIGQENKDRTKKLIHEVSSYFDQNSVNPKIVRIFYSNLMGDIFSNYGLILENDLELKNHEYYHYQIENSDHQQSIMHLFIAFTEKTINEIRKTRYTNSKVLINRAINHIQYHYDEKISLDDVARELHISKHYLANAFKKATGENMSLYINKLRIEKAKRLLLKSDGKIKEIFDEVGYSNQQYFSKVFKKITGMTIMEYKEKMMQKNE
ncbi:MAG: hypothetical protein APF77_12240 [Clostridia bacterium BRH_c25]|nr:MAG: hypothetical protein APF77_12240 [Clostridia bacterium BRH_c25]